MSPCRALCVLRLPILAAGAVEFAHEAGKSSDGFEGDGVIERDAHTSNGAVSGRADQAGSGSFLGELIFEVFVPAGHAEDDVHFQTPRVLNAPAVKTSPALHHLLHELC